MKKERKGIIQRNRTGFFPVVGSIILAPSSILLDLSGVCERFFVTHTLAVIGTNITDESPLIDSKVRDFGGEPVSFYIRRSLDVCIEN